MKKTAIIFLVVWFVVFFSALSLAGQENKHHGLWAAHPRVGQVDRSRGQLLYVPTAYLNLSNLGVFQFAFSRVVIRNLDPFSSITVNSVMFHDQNGVERLNLLGEEQVTIEAFKSISLSIGMLTLVPHQIYPGDPDSGRSFVLVDWDAEEKVITPSIGSVVGIVLFDGAPSPITPYTYKAMMEMSGTVLEER